jgi:transposase InsO family protein
VVYPTYGIEDIVQINLHKNATTTPKTRAYIQSSSASVTELALELGISETTVRRWKERDRTTDGSHVRHNLGQSTTAVEEALIVELRRDVGLSLDDIVEVMKRCVNPKLSRSAIHRAMQRLGVAQRPVKQEDRPPAGSGTFEATTCGFIHIDLKYLPRLEGQPAYVFVAIDRATRFAHIEIVTNRRAETIQACLANFLKSFPHPVHTILTDNGSEFTDRFAVDMKDKPEGKPSGKHLFDRTCAENNIEHRLTKPFHPQTNGMAERFNRRIGDAIETRPATGANRGKNKFATQNERNDFLNTFVYNYNRTRLRVLGYMSPVETLHNLTGHNTFAGKARVFQGTNSAHRGTGGGGNRGARPPLPCQNRSSR